MRCDHCMTRLKWWRWRRRRSYMVIMKTALSSSHIHLPVVPIWSTRVYLEQCAFYDLTKQCWSIVYVDFVVQFVMCIYIILLRLCWFEPVDSIRFVRIIAWKSIAPLELSVKILSTPRFVHICQSVDIHFNVHDMRKLRMITHSYDCWFAEGRRQNNTPHRIKNTHRTKNILY